MSWILSLMLMMGFLGLLKTLGRLPAGGQLPVATLLPALAPAAVIALAVVLSGPGLGAEQGAALFFVFVSISYWHSLRGGRPEGAAQSMEGSSGFNEILFALLGAVSFGWSFWFAASLQRAGLAVALTALGCLGLTVAAVHSLHLRRSFRLEPEEAGRPSAALRQRRTRAVRARPGRATGRRSSALNFVAARPQEAAPRPAPTASALGTLIRTRAALGYPVR